MPTRKLSPEDERRLAQAYEAWDPTGDPGGLEQIAEGFGVSRQTAYAVIKKYGIRPKSHREDGTVDLLPGADMTRAMANQALDALIRNLVEAQQKVDNLRRQLRDVGEEPNY